jgi:hypothetical protein
MKKSNVTSLDNAVFKTPEYLAYENLFAKELTKVPSNFDQFTQDDLREFKDNLSNIALKCRIAAPIVVSYWLSDIPGEATGKYNEQEDIAPKIGKLTRTG